MEAPSNKESKSEESRGRHGLATGLHGRTPEVGTTRSRLAESTVVPRCTGTYATGARPCVGAQAPVRLGTAVPSRPRPCILANFRLI